MIAPFAFASGTCYPIEAYFEGDNVKYPRPGSLMKQGLFAPYRVT